MIFRRAQSGQIVLILVLITVIGLTVGLSLVARTITDVRISSQIEQSSRAFSAAEAGIESALRSSLAGSTPSGTLNLSGVSATYTVDEVGGTADTLTFPITELGNVEVLWLANHTPDGALDLTGPSYSATEPFDVCWGTKAGTTPAVSLTLLYSDGTEYKISKAAYDSVSRGNNFTVTSDTTGGYCDGNFQFRQTITPTDTFGAGPSDLLILLRIQPLYDSSGFGIAPSVELPNQGRVITSIGQSTTGIVRKIQVNQGYPVLPNMFDFTLFTEN